MRFLYTLFILMSATVMTISAQHIQVDKIQKKSSEQVHVNGEVPDKELMHTYICRRCGSENQMDWVFAINKELELIPHCGFCGKKYWPKFKPSGLLERTYCLNSEPLNSRLGQH